MFEARTPPRCDVARAHAPRTGRPRRPRHPPPKATRRPRCAPSPCATPRGLGVLPATRTPWTAPYRPVHAADRRSVGSTPPYVRRSRWSCYDSISGVTATSPGGLHYKNPSAVCPPRATPTRRLPSPPPPCAHASASSHRRPTFPTYSLGPVAPSQTAPCHQCALPSREPEPPRPPPAIIGRPHRRLLRPNYGHHPILGEHVVDPDPSPGRERRRSRRIPANRAAPTAKGGIARGRVFLGRFVQSRGISVRH
jgi:hypothetical protein